VTAILSHLRARARRQVGVELMFLLLLAGASGHRRARARIL
jgi:hypothetical protein